MSTFTANAHPKKESYFLSQPHQPFFVFGIFWALLSMIIFTLSHKGIITLSLSENEFHLYTLAFIVFIQFFHGFLFTTFPRFCTSMPIPKEVYIRIIWLYQISSALIFIGSLTTAWLVIIGMAGLLFAHAMALYTLNWVYRIGQSPLKTDPYWILIAHFIGIAFHVIWIVSYGIELLQGFSGWLPLISPAIVNLYLIFLTFSVAQRMIPFFSHSMEPKSSHLLETVFAFLIFKTLFEAFSFQAGTALIDIILSLFLFREFLRWKLHPFHSPAILWILHLSLFWIPVALLIDSIIQIIEMLHSVTFLFAGTHLLVLGFLTTVLIGFGTRVTLGHSGQPPHADRVAIGLFWWTQILIIARFALSVDYAFGGQNNWIFDAAAFAWIVLFALWSLRYGKILIVGKEA